MNKNVNQANQKSVRIWLGLLHKKSGMNLFHHLVTPGFYGGYYGSCVTSRMVKKNGIKISHCVFFAKSHLCEVHCSVDYANK